MKGNQMSLYHISLEFARQTDAQLDAFTGNVIAKLTGNASYPTPPVTMAALTTAWTEYQTRLANAAHGGAQATAAKNAARETLVGLLRQEANYVEGAGNNDLPTLLASGFGVTSTNNAQSPLDKPAILRIENEFSTQLLVRLSPIENARAYQVRIATTANSWQDGGIFTQARRVVLQNLVPGTVYNVQARAVGGSTGFSDWSDPVSHMAL